MTVESTGDGTIATTGLSRDPAKARQEWYLIGAGLFAGRGGDERISFGRDGILSGGHVEEAATFQRSVVWPYAWLLSFGLAVCLLSFVGMPIAVLVRRLRGRPARHRVAWWLVWVTSALVAFFFYGVMTTIALAPTDALLLGSPLLTGMLVASSLVLVLSGVVALVTVLVWWKRWWGPLGRVAYSVFAAGAVSFMVVAHVFNAVGWPFA